MLHQTTPLTVSGSSQPTFAVDQFASSSYAHAWILPLSVGVKQCAWWHSHFVCLDEVPGASPHLEGQELFMGLWALWKLHKLLHMVAANLEVLFEGV